MTDEYQNKIAKVKAKLKANKKKKQQEDEVIKTSDVPTAPTPMEKANALQRKVSNQYTSYIASKLLPGLE